jgi:atypical dual specificity phosphatase
VNGFSWVIENEIAGMASPAGKDDALWPWLAERGIGLVVSLTTRAPDKNVLARHGLELLHLPVQDFTPPTPDDIDAFVEHARFHRHEGRAIVVHCGAGIGRTGTMIACYLVDRGMTAEEAVATVRKKRPGSVETKEQADAVASFAERHKTRG